jgi:hypothetical protein
MAAVPAMLSLERSDVQGVALTQEKAIWLCKTTMITQASQYPGWTNAWPHRITLLKRLIIARA